VADTNPQALTLQGINAFVEELTVQEQVEGFGVTRGVDAELHGVHPDAFGTQGELSLVDDQAILILPIVVFVCAARARFVGDYQPGALERFPIAGRCGSALSKEQAETLDQE
jgi:hypothetical protein